MLIFMLVAALVSAVAAITLTLLGFTRWFVVGIAALVIVFGITPATVAIAENVGRDSASTYNEYWNGYELAATSASITCVRDGSCVHSYDCDPYLATQTYTDKDSNGNIVVKTRTVTKYHDCPYATQETSYYVNTTIGNMVIADRLMTGTPYRNDEPIPGGRQSAPRFWLAAKERVEANQPGPVTAVHTYENYILASQTNLFKKYSGQINQLTKQHLLPAPSSGVYDYYNATKAYFVGNLPALDTKALTKDVAYLGAATGAKLQGDLHVVFVNANQAPSPTTYLNSLLAYWQSPVFDRNDISKNAIIVAIGVGSDPATGKPVATWVRAATGMPIGNEALLVDIRNNLENQPITTSLIGRPEMDVRTQALVHSTGLLETTLFGSHQFQRVSMSANSKGDKGLGYKYLRDSIPVPAAAYIISAIIITLLGGGLLLLSCYLSAMMSNSVSFRYSSRRY